MKVIQGNLWDWHARGYWIVVTTNIGWDPDTLENNMGAGVALQASLRFPGLARQYGELCSELREETPVVPHLRHRLFLFPVKPLIANDPAHSWAQDASLGTLCRSVRQLRDLLTTKLPVPCAMALPGAGNGGLDPVTSLRALAAIERLAIVVDASADHRLAPYRLRALE
jgi:hypothetical protein